MIDADKLGFIEVLLFGFMPVFVCALLIRAKGILGILAILGMAGVAYILLSDFSGWRLGLGGVAALVGMAIGGTISDRRERAAMVRKKEEEQREREARLKAL